MTIAAKLLRVMALVLAAGMMLGVVPGMPVGFDVPTARASQDEVLYVALIWHNHQPCYKNPETGLYELPWVRLHATKDYYDMAAILKDYPGVHVTFNMVPSLLMQLEDYSKGASDRYLILSQKAASELTEEDKEFILRRFFDANWEKVIPAFPRYEELLNLRGRDSSDDKIAAALKNFTEQDFRDLQVLFNLAWIDPGIRKEDPQLDALVKKGRGFSEQDKKVVLDKQKEIIGKIVPLYRELQNAGIIEITTTPFYHPILPLLYDTGLAQEASPGLELPKERFADPAEVERQVKLGVEFTEKVFGKKPEGMWPPEMAVSQHILPIVARAGISWIVADEGILAKSLSKPINRTPSGEVKDPDLLYSAYRLTPGGSASTPLYILFRDRELSDAIGFRYSGMKGQAAAEDLYGRLKAIQRSLKEAGAAAAGKPHIVTIALDGENCWEYYENDGIEFLRTFYEKLQSDNTLKAVTVSEFLRKFPPEKTIEKLATGSWIDANLETWIGEPDENLAWSALARAKNAVDAYVKAQGAEPGQEASRRIEAARASVLAAEGSDWFWWYGNDQNSANDEAFDALFRAHLKGVYRAIAQTPPAELDKPIVGTRAQKAIPEDLNLGELVFEMSDPSGDDNGPGTYTYPQDPIFKPGDFDLKKVEIYKDDTWLSFKVFLGHIANGWNSPIGISVQTIDIYLRSADEPGKGSSGKPARDNRALPGRYVLFQPGNEWDHAIWVEGWIQKTFGPNFQEIPEAKPVVLVDEAKGVVVIRVPISIVGVPEKFNVLIMGQEGFPSEGNWRVRDVTEKGAQWRFGGGSNQPGEPNVIDMLVPPGKSQAKLLKAYDIAQKKLAAIPMVAISSAGAGTSTLARLAPFIILGIVLLAIAIEGLLSSRRKRRDFTK